MHFMADESNLNKNLYEILTQPLLLKNAIDQIHLRIISSMLKPVRRGGTGVGCCGDCCGGCCCVCC